MQTFLPYKSFTESAGCLDYKRLGKQRVETKQLLNVLLGLSTGKGWKNHPAAKMWKGYEVALAEYGFIMSTEWAKRGFVDNLASWFDALRHGNVVCPPWLGMEAFHKSHQSNLLRKDYEYYSKFNWEVSDDLEYIWPV